MIFFVFNQEMKIETKNLNCTYLIYRKEPVMAAAMRAQIEKQKSLMSAAHDDEQVS